MNTRWFRGTGVGNVGDEAADGIHRGGLEIRSGTVWAVPGDQGDQVVVGGGEVGLADGGGGDVVGLERLARVIVGNVGDVQQALNDAVVGVCIFVGQDGNIVLDVGRISNITLSGISGGTGDGMEAGGDRTHREGRDVPDDGRGDGRVAGPEGIAEQ